MTVIDSSGWLEFFTDGPLADEYGSRLRKLAATARKFQAELVTSDRDFERITGVTYLPKT